MAGPTVTPGVFERILIIDDSSADVALLKRALAEARFEEPLYHVSDPQEALAYLKGDDKYSDRAQFPLPEVVFLDLVMPGGIDGFNLLKWIKSQPHLGRVIVIVLTGIEDVKKIRLAYQLGAHSYLAKNANAEEVGNVVRFLNGYARVAQTLPKPTTESTEGSDQSGNAGGGKAA